MFIFFLLARVMIVPSMMLPNIGLIELSAGLNTLWVFIVLRLLSPVAAINVLAISGKFLLNNKLVMEKLKVLIDWLKSLPLWLRLVLLLALAVAGAWSLSSCANTKAVVRASSENTTASVTITTNNPTTVNVTNKQDTIGLNFNPKR